MGQTLAGGRVPLADLLGNLQARVIAAIDALECGDGLLLEALLFDLEADLAAGRLVMARREEAAERELVELHRLLREAAARGRDAAA